jgi:hypothetical protein
VRIFPETNRGGAMGALGKRTLMLFLLGSALGFVASMWWGPRFISWWYTPPGSQNSMVAMCGQQLTGATTSLVKTQLLVGAGLGLMLAILGLFLSARRRPKNPRIEGDRRTTSRDQLPV